MNGLRMPTREKHTTEIIPCKHCGSQDVGVWSDINRYDEKLYRVECAECEAVGYPEYTIEFAIKTWNGGMQYDN